MSQFLKLTSVTININQIKYIKSENDSYIINLVNHGCEEIIKIHHAYDIKLMQNWINSL